MGVGVEMTQFDSGPWNGKLSARLGSWRLEVTTSVQPSAFRPASAKELGPVPIG